MRPRPPACSPRERPAFRLIPYGGPDDDERFYASIMSDADWQRDTGNFLVTSGMLETDTTPAYSCMEILEVDESGVPVFKLRVGDPEGNDKKRYEGYSSDRIPDIRLLQKD